MVLENVDRYRVVEPLFEGVRVVMSYLGEPYSPAYVQGISGAAFRVAGICPCAPTCSTAMWTTDLIALLGYECECHSLAEEGMDPATDVQAVVAHVKEEIRAGRPTLVWHAFTYAEWDVVCGYDEKNKQFLGRGSYGSCDECARADEARMAKAVEICPAYGAVLIREKTCEYNSRGAEVAALREAVRHARSTWNSEKLGGEGWVMLEGLMCYDRWASEFESDPARERTNGDAYCLGVYRSTRRAASDFVREIAPRYPDARSHLQSAAGHFAAEADALDECVPLLGWESLEGRDVERNAAVAPLLRRARDSYSQAIDQVEAAIPSLEI
jgi:hypothetical protein